MQIFSLILFFFNSNFSEITFFIPIRLNWVFLKLEFSQLGIINVGSYDYMYIRDNEDWAWGDEPNGEKLVICEYVL